MFYKKNKILMNKEENTTINFTDMLNAKVKYRNQVCVLTEWTVWGTVSLLSLSRLS